MELGTGPQEGPCRRVFSVEGIADRISKAGMNNVVVKPQKEGLCGRNLVTRERRPGVPSKREARAKPCPRQCTANDLRDKRRYDGQIS